MENFKPGDKVRHDGNEPYVFYGGPVEGVVIGLDTDHGLVIMEAVPAFGDPAKGAMTQHVTPANLTMIQEGLF